MSGNIGARGYLSLRDGLRALFPRQPLAVNGEIAGLAFGGPFAPNASEFNLTLSGSFAATLILERSFDAGITWLPLTYIDGSPLQWTGPVSVSMSEPEAGVQYRVRCTAFTSGPIKWRLSQ